MNTPLASPTVRAAIDDLTVAAEQLQLMVTRAAVVGHPLHPALEGLAVGTLRTCAGVVLRAAEFIACESVRHREERDR